MDARDSCGLRGFVRVLCRSMPRNHHGALFKAVFSQPEQAAAHLRAVLPTEVTRHLDFDHLRHSPGSFVDEELSDRHTDLLFEVAGRGDAEGDALLYVLFEDQSSPDPLMPFRLLGYLTWIWQHLLDRHPRARTLPLVIPVVRYHGGERWSVRVIDDERGVTVVVRVVDDQDPEDPAPRRPPSRSLYSIWGLPAGISTAMWS